jgi:23S rRNA (cytidine2498-2'-O)-methyltransferase
MRGRSPSPHPARGHGAKGPTGRATSGGKGPKGPAGRAAQGGAGPKGPGPRSASSGAGPHGRPPAKIDPRAGTTSPRIPIPAGTPLSGPWLWLTRPGSEGDLVSELRLGLGERARASSPAPGLVRSELAATFEDGSLDATFARHGVRWVRTLPADAAQLAAAVRGLATGPIALDAIVADTDEGNRLAGAALALEDAVAARLEGVVRVARERARDVGATLVDLVFLSPSEIALGAVEPSLALTLHAQGRARMKVAGDRPSRAARKVEEALDWLGLSPGPGEVCVDLGAAPGGWSWSLLGRRARVVAVDPAELRPDVARHPRLTHVKASAFTYGPDEPIDWLFCDMAWRPREAAQMLAKWARKRWARILVANLKLPMKQKAEMVRELREILHGGGWQRVRSRQLYHDRDEITVTAHR